MVLSGGGSRGAYEAGILQFIRERVPALVGHPIRFDIVTGTSVGAINASFLAATCDMPDSQARRLCDAWRSLELESLISLRARDVFRAAQLLLGRDPPPPKPGDYRHGGILDTAGLEKFVIETTPWRGIRRNLISGHLSALAVSATHVGTGRTIVFVDSKDELPKAWSRNPFVDRRREVIGPRHALASAAIPILFSAVKIGRSFYVDGGLRQNTPMAPAIRLGADRLLVISLRHDADPRVSAARQHEREEAHPKPLFLAGKALNALLLDHTEYDLERMERLNSILVAGTAAFGTRFEDVLSRELTRSRGAPLRYISAVHVRPSIDIGEIAAEFVRRDKIAIRGRVARRLIGRLAAGEAEHENDLLSYLLFDGNFCGRLVELGFRDAESRADDIAELFSYDVRPESQIA